MSESQPTPKQPRLDAAKLASSGTIGTVPPHFDDGHWTGLIFPAVMLTLVVVLSVALIWLIAGQPDPRGQSMLGMPAAPAATATSQPTALATLAEPTATEVPPTATSAPTATAVPTHTPTVAPTWTPTATPEPTPAPVTYTVASGDSPSEIAKQFGISTEALMEANDITDPRRLRVGQVLVIPTTVVAPGETVSATPEATPAAMGTPAG